MKIGICGHGMVGSAIHDYFKDAYIYDKYKKLGSPEELNKADIIFVAVPTPYSESQGFDISEIKNALKHIKNNAVVIIKSTVLPGTTDELQIEFSKLNLLFNPEFLTEKTHIRDFRYPNRQIIGYTEETQIIAEDILELLPYAPFKKVLTAREAEIIKLISNTYYGLKVIFGNQVYELCIQLGMDYKRVKECFVADKRVTDSHFDIFHKGYRGYGGACLPKDVRALVHLAKELNVDLGLFKSIVKINDLLQRENER